MSPAARHVRALTLVLLLLAIGSRALAQSLPEWIPVDGGASGTPATITLDERASTSQQTVFNVVVHGFWKTTRVGADHQTYHVIEVPGLTSLNLLGEPDLPVARANVAVATNPSSVTVTPQVIGPTYTFPGINVWPKATEAYVAEDGVFIDEQFTKDQSTYLLNTIYPTSRADVLPGHELAHTVQGRSVECRPVRWNPTTKVLSVDADLRLTVSHAGSAVTAPAMTKHRFAMAQTAYINWPVVDDFYPFDTVVYNGDYLFVVGYNVPSGIQPLVDQKKARGFHTTVINLGTPHTCDGVRALIQGWYNDTPPERDHYCLLVGDVDAIPLCAEPLNGWKTDDLYADAVPNPEGVFATEVFLGRLSIGNQADLQHQVSRILTYEDSLGFNESWLDSTVLIAHEQDAPDLFQDNQEYVRTYAYSQVQPECKTVYGGSALNDNTDITHAIDDGGAGIICYQGHGSSTSFSKWNLGQQSWTTSEVAALSPDTRMLPVVWSFSCSNSNIDKGPSLGERWMESWDSNRPSVAAVAHYGATGVSGISQNFTLNKRMWQAVFDQGLTTISHAIANAELWMRIINSTDENAYKYMLLGDPEMQIRRERPQFPVNGAWVISQPSFVAPLCPTHGCCEDCPAPPIDIRVLDTNGQPVPGVKVAYWKSARILVGGDSVDVDEALGNRYTGSDGWAHVPAPYLTKGTIYLTVTDDFGNSYTGTIPVRDAETAVEDARDAGSPTASLSAAPSVLHSHIVFRVDGTRGGERITVYDLMGRVVRHLDVRATETSVTWDGRDATGRLAPNGTYVARTDINGRSLNARVFVMH